MLNSMSLCLLLPVPLFVTAMLPLIPSYSLDNLNNYYKYDPLLQEFVWFEDDNSIVDSTEDSDYSNVTPKGLLRRKQTEKIREIQKTILRLR